MKIIYLMNNISKILAILSLPLLLNACGGGGGGGGAAGGGVGTGTVSYCTDSGTSYQTYEYYNGGSDLNQNAGNNSPLQYVCASSAYARDATGDGIQIAVVDTGVKANHTELDSNMATALTGSDTIQMTIMDTELMLLE
jgi:subtilisin family serine protease